jgi:hypothetical protein
MQRLRITYQVHLALTLCHILHSVSHWPVLVYFIKVHLSLERGTHDEGWGWGMFSSSA